MLDIYCTGCISCHKTIKKLNKKKIGYEKKGKKKERKRKFEKN